MANLELCENVVRMMLKDAIGDDNPSEEDIKAAINKVAIMMPMTENEKLSIEKNLQASYKVRMDMGEAVVREATYHPWLASRKAHIEPYYWNRYAKYLLLDAGWNQEVIDTLSDVSDAILDLCGNPAVTGTWKRKGLILGDIQSGKTSNYLALCNKAADAGYKIIILLTGTLESLRKQTQERVDAGFVGLNSRNVLQKNPEKKYVGVGSIDSNRTAYQFTSVLSDFNSAKLQALNFTIKGLNEPVILVLKKNKSILENLTDWLSTRNTSKIGEKIDLPLLLIDDEADNASINTNKPDSKPTAINGAIVNVLKLFKRSSYVGVTATPFANIFIDPELDQGPDDFNLFPSDFIYSLSAPTNYIGARQIFNENSEYYNSIETIEDVLIDPDNGRYVFRSKDKTAHKIPYMPQSLKEAIRYFILANTVRDLDGNTTTHRSMLINVSQYVNVQNQLYDMVSDYLKKLVLKIQSYSKLSQDEALRENEMNLLYNTWNNKHLTTITGYEWPTIQNQLYESASPIITCLVNQKSKEKGRERLDYEPYKETGLRVIAIGGNSLSRGLTLEGLMVSYFDRNSQMYDTLMQMGRWFGYRKGYEDLFKIWMEPEAIDWYEYISDATDELREEISEMRRLGLTPKDFGLKVQQNMTSLFVTARSKMRATTVVEQWITLAAKVIETPRLIADRTKCLEANLKITNKLLSKLEENHEKYVKEELNFSSNRIVYTGVDKKDVAQYVRSFIAHPRHIPFSAKDLSDYIENKSTYNSWTVAVIGGSGKSIEEKYFEEGITSYKLRYSSRVIRKDDTCLLISGKRARVGVPGATKYGLKQEQIIKIDNDYREANQDVQTIPDKAYLAVERDPVLLIYIIKIDTDKKATKEPKARKFDSDEESIKLIEDLPVIALGLGFPGKDGGSSRVRYVLNRVGERELREFEEDEENEG